MSKEIDRIFTVLAFQVMEWQHGICDHFVALYLREVAFSFDLSKYRWTN